MVFANKIIVVQTTVAKRSDALRLSKLIVDKRLAACVQIIPGVTSTYIWRGKCEVSKEFLIQCKTLTSKKSSLFRFLKAQHPYDVPEIIVTPIIETSASYASWMKAALKLRSA